MKNVKSSFSSILDTNPSYFRNLISANYRFSELELKRYWDQLNWKLLSGNRAMRWDWKLILTYKNLLAWDEFSLSPAFRDVSLIDQFKDLIRWNSLDEKGLGNSIASNPYICWSPELIDLYLDRLDFYNLSQSSSAEWSSHLLNRYLNRWDWGGIAANNYMPWSLSLFEKYKKQLDPHKLRMEFNTGMISSFPLVDKYFNLFDDEWIFRNPKLPWKEENLLERWKDKLNWDGLSINQQLLRDPEFFYQSLHRWFENPRRRFSALSMSVVLPWSLEFIDRFLDCWNWDAMSRNPSLPWSNEFIEYYRGHWNWQQMSLNTGIPWSIEFIEQHPQIPVENLFQNPAVWEKAFKPLINKELIKNLMD